MRLTFVNFTVDSGNGFGGVRITFPSKPAPSVLAMLKANKFKWHPDGFWYKTKGEWADFVQALENHMENAKRFEALP